MDVKAENLTDRDMSIGMRLILDSYLGEKSGMHFLTDLRPKISGETVLAESAKDSWLVSPSAENGKVGLKVGLKAGTSPDSVILANWSRINSSPWRNCVSLSKRRACFAIYSHGYTFASSYPK